MSRILQHESHVYVFSYLYQIGLVLPAIGKAVLVARNSLGIL